MAQTRDQLDHIYTCKSPPHRQEVSRVPAAYCPSFKTKHMQKLAILDDWSFCKLDILMWNITLDSRTFEYWDVMFLTISGSDLRSSWISSSWRNFEKRIWKIYKYMFQARGL